MQFQRALTVGKLLLGHNLVNLCSLRILPYLTQPDTVTQECGPSLWPLVRCSPRVSGHSGEAAPASESLARCSHPKPRAARGWRARGSPPPRSPGRRPGSAPGRSVSDGGASVRPGPPRASVLGAPSLVSIPKGPRDRASPTPVGPSSGPRAGRFSPQVAGGALGAGR